MALTQAEKQARERYLEKVKFARSGSQVNPFETPEEQQAAIKRAQKDVGYMVERYLKNFATSDCADFQIRLANRVAHDPQCLELVRWGRGLAKSVWCDLIIPLWLWMRGEHIYLVIVGNNQDKAELLLADIQAEFEGNPQLIKDFGEMKQVGSWEYANFRTSDGRFMGKAIGMGTSPRGLRVGSLRPNLLVADDLEDRDTVKNPSRQDEVVTWIEKDLIPTMDGPVQRYLHPNNDFAPRTIQNQLEARHPDWHVDTVKAYNKVTYVPAWPQKYDNEYYRTREKKIGIIAAHAEYLHEPHVEGKVFTDKLFQWAPPPRLNAFKILIGHWDVAYSGNNDHNAIPVWGLREHEFWKMKSFCRQCKMEDAIRFMYDFESTLPKSVMVHWRVEEQFWNDPVRQAIDAVRQERGRWLNIALVKRSSVKKYDRLMSMHPYYQNGRIYYNENERYNSGFVESTSQLKGIEPGYRCHDDGPDADQQAVEYLAQFVSYDTGVTGEDIEFGDRRRNNKY